MTPTERLIRAWLRWDAFPGSRDATTERLAAIAALGLHSNRTHELVAAARHDGYDVPSAVQTAINDQRALRRAS